MVLLCTFCAFFLSPLHVFASQDSEEVASSITSTKAYVYDFETGQVLLDKGSKERIYPASLTKIMTALVTLESGVDVNTPVTITEEMVDGLAEANASIVGYSVGEAPTVYDLLYGTLLPSGADAVNALAFTVSGSIEGFVEKMNQKAEELHMDSTHFVNPTGLHEDNHYSTCRDIAILLQEALKNDTFKTIFCTQEYTDSLGHTMEATINNSVQAYSISLPGFEGDKTGYTDEAGHCMASYSELNGMQILIVTADAQTDYFSPDHLFDASSILDWLNTNYSRKTIYTEGDLLSSYEGKKVIGKDKEEIPYASSLSLDVRNDATITVENDVAAAYTLKNDTQEKTASITVCSDGETIYTTSQEFTVPKVKGFFNTILTFFRDLF